MHTHRIYIQVYAQHKGMFLNCAVTGNHPSSRFIPTGFNCTIKGNHTSCHGKRLKKTYPCIAHIHVLACSVNRCGREGGCTQISHNISRYLKYVSKRFTLIKKKKLSSASSFHFLLIFWVLILQTLILSFCTFGFEIIAHNMRVVWRARLAQIYVIRLIWLTMWRTPLM